MQTSSDIHPSRARGPWSAKRVAVATLGLILGFSLACYGGGEREKQAPRGYAGGLCNEVNDCNDPEATCETKGGYCYNPLDPCEGFFCNSHGTCTPVGGKPSCICDPGFTNINYSLYCE